MDTERKTGNISYKDKQPSFCRYWSDSGPLIGGMAIGYSKAREICLQAIIQATGEQKKTEATENEEEP